MKKIIYLGVFVVSALLMISCEKDEIGGTATENVAGEWKVTATEVDANRKEVKRLSNILIATYNSAANSATEIWVDNNNKLLKFKVKAKADMNTLTFSVANGANAYGGEQTTLKDGEILMGQATTPSGIRPIVSSVMFHSATIRERNINFRAIAVRVLLLMNNYPKLSGEELPESFLSCRDYSNKFSRQV